jgi:hypothetical protein
MCMDVNGWLHICESETVRQRKIVCMFKKASRCVCTDIHVYVCMYLCIRERERDSKVCVCSMFIDSDINKQICECLYKQICMYVSRYASIWMNRSICMWVNVSVCMNRSICLCAGLAYFQAYVPPNLRHCRRQKFHEEKRIAAARDGGRDVSNAGRPRTSALLDNIFIWADKALIYQCFYPPPSALSPPCMCLEKTVSETVATYWYTDIELCLCSGTNTHIYSHTYGSVHTKTHIYSQTYGSVHTNTHIYSHTYGSVHSNTRISTHIHTDLFVQTLTYLLIYIRIYKHTTYTHFTISLSLSDTQIHTHIHMYICTHTSTCLLKHTYYLSLSHCLWLANM